MRLWFVGIATICRIENCCNHEHFLKMPRPCRVSPFFQLYRSALKAVVGLAEQFDVLDIRRDFVGGQRRLRVGLGEAVEAKHLRVNLAPEIGAAIG